MLKTTLGLAIASTVYYKKNLIQTPKLYHHPDTLHQSFIQNSVLLNRPFSVTPWLISPHLQIIYHTLKQKKQSKHPLSLEVQSLVMPDGTMTELAWLGRDLSENKPTIIILHTITGSPLSMQEMLEDLHHATGWRIVLCLRRGHTLQAQPLGQFNIMGSVPDFKIQLQHIHDLFPDSHLYLVGSSAGTALLARYLGDVGADTPIKAAFAYSPGYDLSIAFDRVKPIYDRYMAKAIKQKFLLPHQSHLQKVATYKSLLSTPRLSKMHKLLFSFAGYTSYQDYLDACNPVNVLENIQVPTLLLNAEDDPICHIDNAKQYFHLIEQSPYLLLATTRHGSHCIHYQHWRPRSWAHELIAEYFLNFENGSNI